MSLTSRLLFCMVVAFTTVGFVATSIDVSAKDKKKKEDKKDKKDDKDKKEEKKKEEFKPDKAAQEFKYEEKDKTFWVYAVAFSADGKSVAASYRNLSVIIWDLAAKKSVQTLKSGETKGVGDFKSLVFADSTVYVGSGKLIKRPKEKEKDKTPPAKDKDGKAKDKTKEPVKELPFREGEIKSWDAKSGKPGKSLMGHTLNIDGIAASKDGKFLASASQDGTVKIWDLAKGADTQTIKGHTDYVTSVSFSPDGKRVVTTSKDRTLRVWDVADAKEFASFKVEVEVEVKDPKAKDPKAKGKMVKELGREFTRAVFTNDGKKIIGVNLDGHIKIFDVDGKKEEKDLKAHEGIWALSLSPDGTTFATGGFDGTIKIWNLADGKELKSIKAHVDQKGADPGNVNSIAFSPDGMWLASGGIDGTVKIWSVK